jgi:hypothetical protein
MLVFLGLLIACSFLVWSPKVKALGTEQIRNGSFETNNGYGYTGFTNWTTVGNWVAVDSAHGYYVHSGSWSAFAGNYPHVSNKILQNLTYSVSVITITTLGFYYSTPYGWAGQLTATIYYNDSTFYITPTFATSSPIYENLTSYLTLGKFVSAISFTDLGATSGNIGNDIDIIDDVSLIGTPTIPMAMATLNILADDISTGASLSIPFTLNGTAYTTSYSQSLLQSYYTLSMGNNIPYNNSAIYQFVNYTDGLASTDRSFNLTGTTTFIANYQLVNQWFDYGGMINFGIGLAGFIMIFLSWLVAKWLWQEGKWFDAFGWWLILFIIGAALVTVWVGF